MAQRTAIYDPRRQYEVKVFDVEYRRADGRSWMARVYQPQGAGPSPALLDVHGGAWSGGDRTVGELRASALASSGLLVASIDLRTAPDFPYPSQVQDANYGTRWLKARAKDFNCIVSLPNRADASAVGIFGSSSGGHTAMLSAMLPFDKGFCAIPLPGAAKVDATVAYVAVEAPVLDPYARYLFARETKNERLETNSFSYFLSEEGMRQGNAQTAIESRPIGIELPPVLLLQGTADNNVPLSIPNRFVESYRKAGGDIHLELFPDMPHGFGRNPGPEAERAIAMIKDFVARQLSG